MSTKFLAYSGESFEIFTAFLHMMGNLKSGRPDFWHFEVPEDLTLCHEEANHPGRIKL